MSMIVFNAESYKVFDRFHLINLVLGLNPLYVFLNMIRAEETLSTMAILIILVVVVLIF